MLYQIAADGVVVIHAAYVAFVVLGQIGVLIGAMLGWNWVRNRSFRWLHLGAIMIVVVEALLGIVCPLTTFESWLRDRGGGAAYRGNFIGHWVHELLFYDAPAWVFTLVYAVFGLVVLATFFIAPPRRKSS